MYAIRIKERQNLFAEYGTEVLDYFPASEPACKELMEMSLQFYCARYPSLFSISADRRTFRNGILNTATDLKVSHPLHVLINNIPEDFAIMIRNEEDGIYYLRAGIICSALGWSLGTKLGMQLKDIHAHVPDYKEKMAFSMDRYFSKMPTDAPIQRGSWGLEMQTPLFMPPGHAHEKLREQQDPGLTIEDCNLRVDWQTLRRLPLSGAICFNFKALFTPVTEFRDEAYIPSLVLKVLKEGKPSILGYKSTWHVEHVVIPELERYEREQYEKGLIKGENGEDKWKVATLEESPFFPGWEKKWKSQQGFDIS